VNKSVNGEPDNPTDPTLQASKHPKERSLLPHRRTTGFLRTPNSIRTGVFYRTAALVKVVWLHEQPCYRDCQCVRHAMRQFPRARWKPVSQSLPRPRATIGLAPRPATGPSAGPAARGSCAGKASPVLSQSKPCHAATALDPHTGEQVGSKDHLSKSTDGSSAGRLIATSGVTAPVLGSAGFRSSRPWTSIDSWTPLTGGIAPARRSVSHVHDTSVHT